MNNLIKNEFKEDLLYGGEYISAGTCEFYQALIGFGAGGTAAASYVIENSLRFNELESAQLNFTNSSAPTDASKGIVGCWIKRTDISHATNQTIIAGGASESVVVHFNAGNQLLWREDGLPGAITTQLFRDPTAWFHLLYSYDSDEGTAANRLQLFINGVEVTAWATAPQNIGLAEAWGITTNGQEITWGDGPNANTDLGAYLAQAFIIDGLSIQNGDYAVSDFIDTDALIEEKTGADISTIFEHEGELGFRDRESKILEGIMNCKNTVVGTGGGIILSEINRDMIMGMGFVVYLTASIKELVYRTEYDKNRPLISDGNAEAKITKILKEREEYYENTSNVRISTDNYDTVKLSKIIIKNYEKYAKNNC